MNIETKKLPKSELEIKIIIPWKEWKNFIDKAVSEISKDIKIKGFRPGKAPRDIIEQKVGKNTILDSAAKKAINKTYADAISREKIDAIGSPRVEILKLAEGNDLEYKAETAVMPEITMKPWKKDIEKVNKDYKNKKMEISDKEMENELKKIANSRVKLITVNREIRKGDSAEIDFQVSRNNVPIENGTSKKHPLVLGSNVFIPGFEENIIGMKEKEEKEFELQFPDKYHDKNLAGKPATFKVKVNLVQERQTPEINDNFAKSLGKFENLENLKNNVKKGLLNEKEKKKKEQKRTELIEKLIEVMEVDVPETLIHSELHKMIEEFKRQLQGMGMTLDAYLDKMPIKDRSQSKTGQFIDGAKISSGKKTKEDLEREWIPQAEKRIKSYMALEKIAKELDIRLSSDKIEEEMNKTLQYYKNVKDLEKNIDTARLYNHIKETLTNEEVFRYLERL